MRNKIAAAALIVSALGGPMLGQAVQTVAWTWRNLLPHNLIIITHNWLFPSDNENSVNKSDPITEEVPDNTEKTKKSQGIRK